MVRPIGRTNTKAVQVWVSQFQLHIREWLASGGVRDDLLQSAVQDLKLWLERSPSDASTIQEIALEAAVTSEGSASPEVIIAFASLGAEADLLITETDEARSARRIFLQLLIAESELRRKHAYAGLDATDLAQTLLVQGSPPAELKNFFDGYWSYLRGALRGLGLDFTRAADAHATAGAALDSLVLDQDRLAKSAEAMFTLVCNESLARILVDRRKQALQQFADHIRRIAALNVIARVRAVAAVRPDDELVAVATDAWQVFRAADVPMEVEPFDVIELVSALPKALVHEAVQILIDRARRWGADANRWALVLHAAVVTGSVDKLDDSTRTKLTNSIRADLASTTDPLIEAFVRGSLLQSAAATGEVARELVSDFMVALGKLEEAHPDALEDARVRARFEGAVAVSIDWAIEDFNKSADPLRRIRLAVLLDALRGARLSGIGAVASDDVASVGTPPAGLILALDRLQRIAYALEQHPRSLAVVIQHHANGVRFICVSGGTRSSVQIIDAGQPFIEAAVRLSNRLREDLSIFELTADEPDPAGAVQACQDAYRALPARLRTAIEASDTLLVVPDYRASGHDIQLELFHDGKAYLAVTRVVARFTSLRALTRAVEHSARRARHPRALVLSSSHPPGWDELVRTKLDTMHIRSDLVGAGWDAPAIDESQVTAKFLTDALPLVAFLYIGAHGDVGLSEGIVLFDGQRFATDDLLKTPFPQLPLSFINTCSLGTSLYLGAGISRGIAHTLVELGAPAAIANLLPVEDGISSDIALDFLARARNHTVGEALRLTRAKVSVDRHPMLWGTTILTGDPWAMLSPADNSARSLPDQLLDAHFTLTPDRQQSDELRARAALESVTDDGNVRLHAAIALLEHGARLNSLDTATDQAQWRNVIRMADELDHLPARAVARYVLLTSAALAKESAASRARTIAEARPYIKAMTLIDKAWTARLQEIDALDSPIRYEIHEPKH